MVNLTTAFVKAWGEIIGAVSWDENTGIASFEYTKNGQEKGWDLSPIKMPNSNKNTIFSFPELRPARNSEYDTFKGLPGLLADSLPDKYGNQLLNAWLAQNGRPQNSLNPIEQLCFIGTRGMGALEFIPSQLQPSKRTFSVQIDSLVEAAKKMLAHRSAFATNLNQEEQEAMKELLKIGTSAGGARPKAIIAYNETTGEVKSGQTNSPKGFEQWMIKLDAVSDVQFGESNGFGRVEMAYHEMAVDAGIEMMPCKLLEENGRAHFMTKRFDREDNNTKHHVQTFCAMQHVDFNEVASFSYEQLFQTMRVLRLPFPQAEQQFRRMAFNVIAKNCDDHTKNFGFRMKENQPWELAPAYDICYAYREDSQWVSQHALSINGKRKNITRDDLLVFAKSISIKKGNQIIDEIVNTVANWKKYATKWKVKPELAKEIEKNLELL